MALEAETKRVVDQFEVTDAYLNSAVKEFLDQMRKSPNPPLLPRATAFRSTKLELAGALYDKKACQRDNTSLSSLSVGICAREIPVADGR